MKIKTVYTLIGVGLLTAALSAGWVPPLSGQMSGTSIQIPAQVKIPAQVLDGGGASSSSGNFHNLGAIGQPIAAGVSQGQTGVINQSGFIPQVTEPATGVCYQDQDKDGYGVSANRIETCSCPCGYVAKPGDCDDTDPGVHPGSKGDLDCDIHINWDDLNIIISHVDDPISECPECDIDGDGKITWLDLRKLTSRCDCAGCQLVCP